ncbi:hypothetical protein BDW67DRAFT_179073 [Aspergillus spinulosporus]
MGFFSAWVLYLSLLPFTPVSLALDCNREFYIVSQAGADNVGRDCPIVSSSVINESCTGSFVLSCVRNITETIKVVWRDLTSLQLTSGASGSELDLPSLVTAKQSWSCAEEEPYSPITSAMNLKLSCLTLVSRLTLVVKTERSVLRLLGRG